MRCDPLPLILALASTAPAQEFVPPPKPATKATAPKDSAAAAKAPPLAPYRLEMRVLDSAGRPIAGAGLAVVYGEDPVDAGRTRKSPIARSGADGRLAVEAKRIADQGARFLLSAKGKVCVRLTTPSDAVKVHGKDVLRRDYGDLVLGDGFDVSGLIRSTAGKPIEGARVATTDVLRRLLVSRYNRVQQANVITNAVSDARGIVRLVGVPKAGVSVTITAEGYYPKSIPFLNRHTPLVASLTEGGVIRGKILGPGGKPIPQAFAYLYSESTAASSGRRRVAAKPDGSFVADVPGPGRYRVYFYGKLEGSSRSVYRWSKVFVGPQDGVVLHLTDDAVVADKGAGGAADAQREARRVAARREKQRVAAAKHKLVVKITDKRTGAVVRKAKVTALWWQPQNWAHNRGYLQRNARNAAEQKTDEQGRIFVNGPREGEPLTGRVAVLAKGYGPLVIKDIEWDENARQNLVRAELELSSSVAGVVKDSAGQPVAGTKVYLVADPLELRNYVPPPMRRKFDGVQSVATTDRDGRFEVEGLSKGKHWVYLSSKKHADGEPVEIEIGGGEKKSGLQLTVPRGGTLFGKLTGVQARLGAQVWIQRMEEPGQRFSSYYSLSGDQAFEKVAIAENGTFEIAGLSRANYLLSLVMRGGIDPIRIPMEPIRMRTKDVHREFDVAEDLPGELVGKVTIEGVSLEPGRVLVLAQRFDQRRNTFYQGRPNYYGHPILLGRNGELRAQLPEGRYLLRLIDLATAVELYRGTEPVAIKPTETHETAITAKLAAVKVTLKPEQAGGSLSVSFLEVAVMHPKAPGQNQNMFRGGDYPTGVGVPIQHGTTEVDLVLPCVETRLKARSSAHNLDPQVHEHNFPPVGLLEFTPKSGVSNKRTLEVTEPKIDVTSQRR